MYEIEPNASRTRYSNASSIQIKWQAPVNNGSPILEYRLYVKLSNATSAWSLNSVVPAASTKTLYTGLVDGLIGGQHYEISITAWNVGGEGPLSHSVTAFTAPAVSEPQMERSSESTAIHLSWATVASHPLAPLQDLRLLYREVSDNSSSLLVVPLELQSHNFTVAGLEPSTLYGPFLLSRHAFVRPCIYVGSLCCCSFLSAGNERLWLRNIS